MAIAVIKGGATIVNGGTVTITPAAGHEYNINVTFGNQNSDGDTWELDHFDIGAASTTAGGGDNSGTIHVKAILDNSNVLTIDNDSGLAGGYHYSGWDRT